MVTAWFPSADHKWPFIAFLRVAAHLHSLGLINDHQSTGRGEKQLNLTHLANYDRDGQRLATMSAYACPLLYAAGAALADGLCVEFGTWAGGSLRCLAAGVNSTGHTGRVHGFDAFKLGFAGNTAKLRETRWWANATMTRGGPDNYDLLPAFLFQTQDIYPSVAAHKLNFNRARAVSHVLHGDVLDVFATDAAKTTRSLQTELSVVLPSLRPGALLIFADFFYLPNHESEPQLGASNQVLWTFLRMSAFMRPLAYVGSYAFFGLVQVPPISSLNTSNQDTFSHSTCLAAVEKARHILHSLCAVSDTNTVLGSRQHCGCSVHTALLNQSCERQQERGQVAQGHVIPTLNARKRMQVATTTAQQRPASKLSRKQVTHAHAIPTLKTRTRIQVDSTTARPTFPEEQQGAEEQFFLMLLLLPLPPLLALICILCLLPQRSAYLNVDAEENTPVIR
eukprot:CAMPEP_0183374348 /NCGR_PEP_ID=MMETSP0164_2-20130417/114233_1 /TAXON_ID=221442 /ORGANISM="Coccolithus pelagicus ssp braarudi, Strain PLY182g" /LENGTH=450 /DNA_ID=CAMNT_0025551367 /DNA_START=145 /DNA_END=1497 /DNA_ORIENTATION=+